MAIHYAFVNMETLKQAIQNMSTALKPNGFVVLTFPNPAYITSLFQAVLEERKDNEEEVRHICDPYNKEDPQWKISITEPIETWLAKSGTGKSLIFYLAGTVVDNIPEYLIDIDLLKQIGSENELDCYYEETFPDAYDSFKETYKVLHDDGFKIKEALSPTHKQIAYLYQCFVFLKRPPTVKKIKLG
jgi:hypothetical protein